MTDAEQIQKAFAALQHHMQVQQNILYINIAVLLVLAVIMLVKMNRKRSDTSAE